MISLHAVAKILRLMILWTQFMGKNFESRRHLSNQNTRLVEVGEINMVCRHISKRTAHLSTVKVLHVTDCTKLTPYDKQCELI